MAGEYVQSLERGLAVIRAFDADSPDLTLSEVARKTDLSRAVARRFLLTLVELGYVRTDGRTFSLRPRVLELGHAYLSSLTLPEVALPHMERVTAQVQESCNLSVLDGEDVVYVERVPTKKIMAVTISVGTRFPAYCTSMGRVLLGGLDDAALEEHLARVRLVPLTRRTVTDVGLLRSLVRKARTHGFAVVDQELEEGLRSVAVPVRSGSGAVVAAMNVSAPAAAKTLDQLRQEVLPVLREGAAAVEADLAAL